ncbi:MAG: 3-phosphoshikimate 1-carboxyvinyltransferase, partial [Candidatus Binatia bacterium]
VKSALLLAGLQAHGSSVIVEPARSRDHSELMLRAMGVKVVSEGTTIRLDGPSLPRAVDVDVCGDPSSAAFFVVAATIVPGSEITIEGVCLNPTRLGFVDLLVRMGGDIHVERVGSVAGEEVGNLHVRAASLRAIDIVAEDVPAAIDELPILAVAAACASGRTSVSGAGELRVKESDRIKTVTQMLASLGVVVGETADGFEIEGGTLKGGSRVESGGDHRLVMSAAVAALASHQPVAISQATAASVSFPEFFEVLEGLR